MYYSQSINISGGLFAYFFIPETKGLTAGQIRLLFLDRPMNPQQYVRRKSIAEVVHNHEVRRKSIVEFNAAILADLAVRYSAAIERQNNGDHDDDEHEEEEYERERQQQKRSRPRVTITLPGEECT